METLTLPKKRPRTHFAKHEIPKALIYEMYDGKPMYYRGFKDVLNQSKTIESIMGASSLQGIIIACILKFFYRNADENQHFVVTNELGLHLARNSNLSSDIAIYDKTSLQNSKIDEHYTTLPPLAVLEVDIGADLANFGTNEFNYYAMKTNRLLDFGVKEVFWFFSASKKVVVARPNQDWIISDWNKELFVLEQYRFSLNQLLDKEGFKI